jgi:hypothetical protein
VSKSSRGSRFKGSLRSPFKVQGRGGFHTADHSPARKRVPGKADLRCRLRSEESRTQIKADARRFSPINLRQSARSVQIGQICDDLRPSV